MRYPILLLLVLCMASCGTPPTRVILLDAGGEDRVAPTALVNISLDEDIPGRMETCNNILGGEIKNLKYATGAVWKRVFFGTPTAPAKLELKSTVLDESVAGGGFTVRYTYTVTAKLVVGDKTYPISANGSKAAATNLESARREAVELAVVSTAKQAMAIIAATQK